MTLHTPHFLCILKRHMGKFIAASVVASAMVSLSVISQTTPPNIKPVNIASIPLYAATQGDKPTLALALSVEFPTVGAQYVNIPNTNEDDSYSPAKEYIGYYNAEKCYSYDDSPSETPAAGKTLSDYKRFTISGAATGRQCSDAFSGNFLNWASSSAIDMLRVALSGGDRYIDEPNLTILQRAVLPNGNPTCMWNSNNFPGKKLTTANIAGAVPNLMATAAGANPIWVANTLNRIYFRAGTAKSGDCGSYSSYTLGAKPTAIGTIQNQNTSLPSDATYCTSEGGTCSVSGTQEIWYGASNKWKVAPAIGNVTCSNGIFGDPISGTPKSCYVRGYTGSWTPPAGGGLNTEGFFYARAQVCNTSGGSLLDDRDYNYCTKYPSGNYKPTGTIQKYNNQLRLAAFGYAMEQTLSWNGSTNGRYGGVLRAPMKYVGPRTYDINGTENTPAGGNPSAEWDVSTGVFKINPDSDATFGISGVINYLNQFGRTGPTAGFYKKYDPASELYYETLRYMQGLPPSPAAVANLNLSNATQKAYYDGYPIYTDWSGIDPFGGGRSNTADYSCLKSNIALIGDINTWDSRYGTGGNGKSRMLTNDIPNNVPDIENWISVVKAFEKKQSKSYTDGQGNAQTTSNPNAANSSPNDRGEQVYGLSYWAHTHDIRGTEWTAEPDKQRPGLRVKSFFFDVNEYATQSVDSQRRKNNQYYTAGKYGGFLSQPTQDSRPYNTIGNPFYDKDGNANNDVWQDPARPLEPQTYFLQSDARGVLAAFEKIFSEAASAQRSIAGASASSSKVTAGSLIYQASFDTSSWWGNVEAFPLSFGGPTGTDIIMGSTPTWSADQVLTNRLIAGSPARNIVVGAGGINPSPRAMNFTVSDISSSLQADLDRPEPGSASDGLWKERLAYIRGDKSKEGSPFRVRFHALGDIINSGVQFVGAPSPRSNLGPGYANFANQNSVKTRAGAIYVGANDGMMHALDADTGEEIFAYIPSWLGPKLSSLTDPDYLHQAYVDATPVIGDIKFGAGSTAADWKTVLVSGSGGGGRGVFALDVTDPGAFDASKVMWEFTQADDADMGFVLGKVRIVKMRTSAPTASPQTLRWFAMVPAGVNNYVKGDDGIFSTTGAPSIFLLALDKPLGDAWVLGTNYYKITLPFDSATAVNHATGIVNLEAYMNETGLTEYVAAGDLHGKLWTLDFTGFGATDWNAGNLSRYSTGAAGSLVAYPMFIAKDASNNIQPITAAPTIIGLNQSSKHLIGFGTGKYMEPSDSISTQANTYYTLYDNGSGSGSGGTPGTTAIQSRGRLQKVTLDAATSQLSPAATFTWGRPTSDSGSVKSGWFYDLPGTGERIVYDSVAVPMTTKAAFSSLIPDSAATPGVCSISGGTGNNYFVDLFYGKGSSTVSLVGVSGQPMVVIGGISEGTSDSTGTTTTEVSTTVIQQGSSGLSIPPDGTQKIQFRSGRLSWRQINNYLELHNK